MSRIANRKRKRRHLSPGQKLLLTFTLLVIFGLCSTVFLDMRTMRKANEAPKDSSDWEDPVTAYVMADEGSFVAPFYNEGLAVTGEYGRGTEITLESWEPFVSESGREYYHAYLDGQMGYILCSNVTDDQSALVPEAQLYVRSTVHMLQDSTDIAIGPLAQKGTLMQVVGYDYFKKDGSVNMYHVMMGEEFGWIKSEYVVQDYSQAMTHWDEKNTYIGKHVFRGDAYGGGDAGGLDYWPHEKGDFAEQGNAMPEDVYSLYIPASGVSPDMIPYYLDLADGTAANAFVITLNDGEDLAYDSPVYAQYGLTAGYTVHNSVEQFGQAVKMLKDAGYYVIGRISTFQDTPMATLRPDWGVTDWGGQLIEVLGQCWLTAFSREVWQMKAAFALEAVDTFGFNEIQFDFVRFPDMYQLPDGSVDTKNTLGESKAQALQRFLTYVTDLLHAHNAYSSAAIYGETGNYYVAAFGQYWPAFSDVVDVICGMPYPDNFGTFYENRQSIVPYRMPYRFITNWAKKVAARQTECASPAIVRTWMQTWNSYGYKYDAAAIRREILAMYDQDIPGGYMLWYFNGSLAIADKLPDVIKYDYRALYEQASAQGVKLSAYMKISTDDTQD